MKKIKQECTWRFLNLNELAIVSWFAGNRLTDVKNWQKRVVRSFINIL